MNEELNLKPSPLYVIVKTIYIVLILAIVACGVVGMLGIGIDEDDSSYVEETCDTAVSCSYENMILREGGDK